MENVYVQSDPTDEAMRYRVYLQSIMHEKHRTIGMRPCDVTPAIADKLLATVYTNIKIAAPARFKLGEFVRVSKFKNHLR